MSGILGISGLSGIDSNLYTTSLNKTEETTNNATFETLFQSALDMIEETDYWTNQVEEEEIKYAMGQSDNTHDLMIAQSKANMSLQYTLAVRNAVVDAYKEIMNLQF